MSEGDLFDDLPPAAGNPPHQPRREDPAGTEPETAPVAEPRREEPQFEEPETPVEAAPPPPVEPEPPVESEPEVRPPERRAAAIHSGSLGEVLTELRKNSGMDLRSVASATRIKETYLEALEKDDFSELPHMVYALAYVKKLCGIYNVAAEDADELMAGLRKKLSYEIPEDIDKSVICREQDEENRRKLQQITIALFAGAALCVLLLVIGATTLILGHGRKAAAETQIAGEQLAEDWLEWHRPQQQLRTTRIDLAPRRTAPRR